LLIDHELISAGAHEAHLNTAGWRPGCYLYRIDVGNESSTRKLLVVN
jgi:hypothetical protein